jgi:hypothetical protein
MTKLYHIQISQYFKPPPETELFSILEKLLPIKMIFGNKQGRIKPDGIIVSNRSANKDISATHPSLSLPPPVSSVNKFQQIETEVEFADDIDVPFPFRGRRVNTKLTHTEPALLEYTHEKVLATCKLGPIWVVSEYDGIKHFRSVLPLPIISSEQNFSDVFNGECFLEMLILLQFIREVSANIAYQNPPLRAGFIIDDPNLHWLSYGFVNYREIAAHAQKENYHISFATIPFDTWFTHQKTADLFRINSLWMSLLIHGNNHQKKELALNYSEEMRQKLLSQAIRRIQRLEQKTNLQVSRVMVPPHGACSDKILAELPKYGFESACVSAASLRGYNENEPWTKTLGFFPAEIIQGCPVLPRWGLSGNVRNTLLVAAYLGQPMILRGHHQDFKDGIELFDEYSRFINSLGNVYWSNMTDLSHFNYQWRMEGTTCRVKPFGRKIVFKVPNEAVDILVEGSKFNKDARWQAISTDKYNYKIILDTYPFSPEEIGSEFLFVQNTVARSPKIISSSKSASLTIILRRLITEARDRLLIFN